MLAKPLGAGSLFSGPINELFLAPVFTEVARVDCGTCTSVLEPLGGMNPAEFLPGLAILDDFETFEVLSDLEGLSDFRFVAVVVGCRASYQVPCHSARSEKIKEMIKEMIK